MSIAGDLLSMQPLARSSVRKTFKKPPRMLSWFLAFAIIATSAGLVHVWVRLQTIRLGYAISEEKKSMDKLKETRSLLAIRLNELKSPERIRKVAMERLKMDMPKPSQVAEIDATGLGQAPVKVASP
jgi:cell division protein FtsL